MSAIRFDGVSLRRGGKLLVRHLDFTVEHGRVTVLIGPNGAGKSTLLLAACGLFAPEKGACLVEGEPLFRLSREEVAAKVAWQGELPPTEFGLTVAQRLALAAQQDQGGIHDAAARMEVDSLLQRRLAELSSGERQRVEIAAAVARDCPVRLFDEPTAHLDLRHQASCLKMLRQEAERGRAVVVVLHDIQQAAAIADSAILLDGRGEAVAGDAKELLNRDRLSNLFQVDLKQSESAGRTLLWPDYG